MTIKNNETSFMTIYFDFKRIMDRFDKMMLRLNKIIFLISFFIATQVIFAQKQQAQKHGFFFNEVSISGNRTDLSDANTKNRNGFGFGIYRNTFRKDKKFNLIIGFEYNRTQLFKQTVYDSHFSNLENVTYTIDNFSNLLNFQYNIN